MRRNQIENFPSALGVLFAYIAVGAAARATHIQELFLKKVIQHYVKKSFPLKIVLFRYDAEIIITLSIW